MSLPQAAIDNTVFADSKKNLLITNDLTTGNILFTSERHNITPQVLGTLVAEEDAASTDSTPRIRIKRMNEDGTLDRVLIRKKLAWRFFCTTDGTGLPTRISEAATGTEMVAEVLTYLNNLFTEVPATTSTILDFGPEDTLDAARDATNTTVLFDNGKEHAVNAIIALENEQGLIDVVDHATQQIHFRNIRFDKVTIVGSPAGNTINSVINALNALFTVNPLGAGYEPSVILPTLEGQPITYNQADETTPVTSDPDTGLPHLQVATGNDPHGSRLWSNEAIDEAGEHFDFKITGKGQFLLGFYEQGVDETELAEGASGNHHTGMYWSLSLYNYGSYMGPHTIYGSNPGLSYGPGWNGNQNSRYASNGEIQDNHDNLYSVLWRAGIDEFGYVYVSYFDAGRTNDYIMVARRGSVLGSGTNLGLAIKLINGTSTLVDVPTRTATDPGAPALAYRYIESPDGSFYYPLFATEEEAQYVDMQNGGADPGSAHAHVFIDEPTGTTWYMPDNGGTHAGPNAPSDTSEITYTEIPTLADDQFAPGAFSYTPVQQGEGTSINIALHPEGSSPTAFTTTVDPNTLPAGIVNTGAQNRFLQGTLPYVSSDTTFDVLVTRTNAYGSTQSVQQITVTDNAALSTIAGWTVHQGNTVSPNIVKPSEGAVLEHTTLLSPGTRVRIPFAQYMKLGIPNATGIAGRETVEIFNITTDHNYFDLLFTVHTNGVTNIINGYGDGIGWVDNSSYTEAAAKVTDVYLLEYRDDDKFYLINEDTGEVLAESAVTYGGTVPLYYGIPVAYTSDKTIPAVTTEAIGFLGNPISGFTIHPDSENLVDASTLAPGSVVALDQAVENNHRLVVRKEWIEANVMPGLQAASGTSQFFIGIPADNADFTSQSGDPNDGIPPNGNVAAEDFKLAVGISVTDEIRGSSFKVKMYKDGAQVHNIGVGGTGLTNSIYDIVFSNVDGRWEMSLQSNFGTPVPGDAATEQRQLHGGSWSQTVVYGIVATGPDTIYLGAQNTTTNLSLTGLEDHREPFLVHDIVVGETSNGSLKFTEIQPSATVFDSVPGGHADFTGTFVGPTLNAGQTYRFIYHPSLEGADAVKVTLASDNSDYTTGVTFFGSGDPQRLTPYKGFTFAVPSDVPPVKIAWLNSYQGNTSYDGGRELPVSGSTHTTEVTGITQIGPSGSFTGNALTGPGWFKLTETLSAGERLVLSGAVLRELFDQLGNGDNLYVGIKSSAWSESDIGPVGFEGHYLKIHRPSYGGNFLGIYGPGSSGYTYTSDLDYVEANYSAFIELTSSGENLRMGIANNTSNNAASTTYSDWSSVKSQTGDILPGGDQEIVFFFTHLANPANDFDTAAVDWTALSEVANPAIGTILTNWTKAIQFGGSSEHAKQTLNGTAYNPLRMGGGQTQIPPHADLAKTSDSAFSRPWAVACVFKPDMDASNQHIWNQGEGSGDSDDNIYLRLSSTGRLVFGWGRSGDVNELDLGFTANANQWYGVYVAYKGQRLDAASATALNLANAFDIRIMGATTLAGSSYLGQFTQVSDNLSTESLWSHSNSSVGSRMNRAIDGDFTIGGRGANRSFKGKIASCVVSTLMIDAALPTTAEIKAILTDPEQWVQDYKVGNEFRYAISDQTWSDFQLGGTQASWGTQVWLMGDGSLDAYPSIYNHITQTNVATVMTMVSMVANDIETINIPGLS